MVHPRVQLGSRRSRLTLIAALSGLLASATTAAGASHVAIAWDEGTTGFGWVGLVAADSPNAFVGSPRQLGREGLLRLANGELLHLSRAEGELTRIQLGAGGTTSASTIVVGADFDLRDVVAVAPSTAWLSARSRDFLISVDLQSGAVSNGIDLSPLGVAEGVLMPERMLVHEGRLYVQLRRMPGSNQASQVAVIDLATESIVDADPVAPGLQAIALEGTEPRYEMQVIPGTNRLMVSATGSLLDAGGIETIDLDTLTTEGVLLGDLDGYPTNDFGPFLMLDSARGWFSGATSIVESSHLFRIDITNPQPTVAVGNEIFFTSPNIVHDPTTDRLFWPIPDGLRYYDATTGVEDPGSPAAVPTGTTTDIELVSLPEAVPTSGAPGWLLLAALSVFGASAGLPRSSPESCPRDGCVGPRKSAER